jgi:DMSO/TMAO reductase YedYZ molybdopterin-dependent catalytic subunit
MSEEKITLSKAEFKKRNRRSFLLAGFGVVCGALGIKWILKANPQDEYDLPEVLRSGLEANESLWRKLYNPKRENSATQAPPDGTPARINSDIGLESELNISDWKLIYESPTLKKTFTLADLEKLPRTKSQSEFRCIEGWSMPIGYEGIRFSDFLAAVDPEGAKMPYVGLETPDAAYYVSIDMESMLHNQTVLADRMNGTPLGPDHGEPLRLIIPLKYGIKNLKRVGRIFLAQEKPRDYWAENGYDWYSGH